MFRSEVTSPLSERNGQRESMRERNWTDNVAAENDLLLKMQRKMAGLDNQQRKVIKEYEQELDAMKHEIKKIRVDYDALKQKNTRYRNQLKEKNDQLKRLQEQSKSARQQNTDSIWTAEKAKLLARLKQLEIEKKQAEDKYSSLLVVKDENADLKREVESLRFRETLWMEEKERAEKERRKSKEFTNIMKYADTRLDTDTQPKSMEWSINYPSSNFNFDDAWAKITKSADVQYSSLPTIHVTDYQESNDLQDIRKSLNEAREELLLAKGDTQSKKDQFLKELKEREELQKTVKGLKDQAESDTIQVREMITTLESKIASLESNCLTEVQNLVRNVDILKKELVNSQHELKSLKEYSRQMERKMEDEKIQMLNESRELKLDLSSLRSEIRDKSSQGSDRTDQSRSILTDSRDQASEENFDSHYSPLVGFVGSRCDYLKMKLDTLKKHLKNLDVQTKTVLNQSIVDASSSSDTITNPNDVTANSGDHKPRKDSGSNSSNSNNNKAKSSKTQVSSGHDAKSNDDNNDENNAADDDDGDIVVVTPRPHRNRYDQELDMLIVENGQNIERLRLPSLEEEDDGEEEEDEDDEEEESERKECRREENRRQENKRHVEFTPSPRQRDRILTRVEEEDEAIEMFLSGEQRRASSLVQQVDSRFEKLERELEMQSRRRQMRGQGQAPMPAYHNVLPKSAH